MFGGEEPVGKVISYNHERDLTVRGTFADLPDNTTVGADAVISLPPAWAAKQMNYSWDGGDSYCQYVRLRPGVDVEALNARMKKMAEKYLPARDSWSYTATAGATRPMCSPCATPSVSRTTCGACSPSC